ncbi:TPA: DUF551 domain-containing protein [Klebsiella pneumoniae]|nr:DUF551 domain-containing protein [Klebsiella pneumoniae]
MSEFSRETLLNIIETDHVQCGDASALARMALAAMDSEPDCNERQLFCSTDTSRMRKVTSVSAGSEATPLHRHAQPAPVVPDAMEPTIEAIKRILPTSNPDEYAACIGADMWNACRAAMLAADPQLPGSDPATVPGKWIPVSERIPDNTEPVLCIEKRADFGTYGQPFVCWHDGGGWVGKTNYRPIVTHWMPLPAAPQKPKP